MSGLDHDGVAVMAVLRAGQGDYRVGDESTFNQAIANFKGDTILLDAPRTGTKRLMSAHTGSTASRIVYVSCDPATFARVDRRYYSAFF